MWNRLRLTCVFAICALAGYLLPGTGRGDYPELSCHWVWCYPCCAFLNNTLCCDMGSDGNPLCVVGTPHPCTLGGTIDCSGVSRWGECVFTACAGTSTGYECSSNDCGWAEFEWCTNGVEP
jgi:hypothetical protein